MTFEERIKEDLLIIVNEYLNKWYGNSPEYRLEDAMLDIAVAAYKQAVDDEESGLNGCLY